MNITIRPVEIKDAEISWRLRSDSNLVWQFMKCDPPLPASLIKEKAMISSVLKDKRTLMFSIFADEEFDGFCTLKNIANGAAELSYVIMRVGMRGKGICTEAVRQLIDIGFNELNLDLIYRYVDRRNVPSIRMTERHKFAPVGISFLNNNVERFEMTRTGWKNQTRKE